MKYVIQLSTGTLKECYYSVNDIIKKLDYITSKIDVTMVIFGWYQDPIYNKKLCNYLKEKKITSVFKLPIFSEITDLSIEDDFVYYDNNTSNHHFYNHDKFDFVCPSSEKNTDYILNIFDMINKDHIFDGVFFDRIRYPAMSVNKSSIYGCMCDNCKKLYQNLKLDNINSFLPIKRNNLTYLYEDSNFNKLMKVKRDIITKQVIKLSKHCKDDNLIVGIDTFAPNIADYVGQDLNELSKYVDFIKPMNYYHTSAPAGIPYELEGLGKNVKNAIDSLWNINSSAIESTVVLSKELLKTNNRIMIGIDANYVTNICDANISYLKEHLSLLDNAGIKEVVLSWNTMLIDNEIIDELSKL